MRQQVRATKNGGQPHCQGLVPSNIEHGVLLPAPAFSVGGLTCQVPSVGLFSGSSPGGKPVTTSSLLEQEAQAT